MLTDAVLKRKAVTKDKPWKLRDGRGLYLLIRPSGSKSWQYDYRLHGKRKTIAFGTYPDVTLQMARERLQAARTHVAASLDPVRTRQAERHATDGLVRSFETVAREWFTKQVPTISPKTITRNLWLLEKRVFPLIGSNPIGVLTPRQVLVAMQAIEDRGTAYTAHRTKQLCSAVFRYAVAHGWAERDITADLRGALTPVKPEHRAAITEPKQIGQLLRAIDGLTDTPRICAALKLAALLFVRPGELRRAEWSEIDLPSKIWRIPAEKMKLRREHLVPLASQAVAILDSLPRDSIYVFPSARTDKRPMSEDALNAGLRRMGYGTDVCTAHGFRSMARTVLAEVLNVDPYHIEAQLAHAAPGPLGRAYDRAVYLPQRALMMQRWADYLDTLRASRA
jgi:integrase